MNDSQRVGRRTTPGVLLLESGTELGGCCRDGCFIVGASTDVSDGAAIIDDGARKSPSVDFGLFSSIGAGTSSGRSATSTYSDTSPAVPSGVSETENAMEPSSVSLSVGVSVEKCVTS